MCWRWQLGLGDSLANSLFMGGVNRVRVKSLEKLS